MNPIVELYHLSQKLFKGDIITKEIGRAGTIKDPEVTAQVTLPNGVTYTAMERNRKLAKQSACRLALAVLKKRL